MKTNRRSLILRLLAVFGGAATVLKTGILQASPADRPARATSRLSPSTVRWADGSERTEPPPTPGLRREGSRGDEKGNS